TLTPGGLASMAIYLIAIAGNFGSDDMATRKAMIAAAKEAGAAAVRFRSLHANSLAHPLFAPDQHARLGSQEMTREEHFELAAACQDAGIDCLSTAFDFEAVDLLCERDVTTLRIASG